MQADEVDGAVGSDRTVRALTGLLDGMRQEPTSALPGVVARAGEVLGVGLCLYLVDYDQRTLARVPGSGDGLPDDLGVDDSLAGRSFRLDEEVLVADDAEPHVWVPLEDGSERVGVVRVDLGDRDGSDPELRAGVRWVVALVGHLVATTGRYGDELDAVRRRRPRTVAAELIWQLLPPLTFASEDVLVTGLTEPCYDVGGDVFDYAVTDGVASLAIFDGTGHSLAAGTAAAVALSAYRNARRNGEGLAATVRAVDDAVADQFGGTLYVSAVLAELEVATGLLRYVGAGHPYPLLVRDGAVVKSLDQGRRPILGLRREAVTIAEEQLRPGDWVTMYTDGITEARDGGGAFFGLPRFSALVEQEAAEWRPTPESLRRLVQAVLEHQQNVLQDDATVMIAVWGERSPHGDR